MIVCVCVSKYIFLFAERLFLMRGCKMLRIFHNPSVFRVACIETFFRERGDCRLRGRYLCYSLPYSLIRLLSPPVCSSEDRSWQFYVHVFQHVYILADVPCSVAHPLNVNDHSLFHLITPTPHSLQISIHHTPNNTPPSPTPLLPQLLPPLPPVLPWPYTHNTP